MRNDRRRSNGKWLDLMELHGKDGRTVTTVTNKTGETLSGLPYPTHRERSIWSDGSLDLHPETCNADVAYIRAWHVRQAAMGRQTNGKSFDEIFETAQQARLMGKW